MSKKTIEAINKVIDTNIEKVLFEGFARYSKYIIQERALPDVRDGLKPVQRRILYAMFKERNTSEHPYRKSAKAVGNVIGNYHPHGDTSVYEAMVRLSQNWKIREPLIDIHGNNGSIDNDPPAAMRYTEARLSKIAEEMLRDIDKQTVDWAPNFDDTELEPTVLPARFPNILVNGSQGISAGYATEIPPHNLEEVIDGVIYRFKRPMCTLDEMMKIIKGPDFPTGGILQGIDGIKEAYETGRGKIVVRSHYILDEDKKQIIITDIPYEVNKAALMKKLEDIRLEKILDGFVEARDETDKDGLRIAIECSKEANLELIIAYLLKNTDLKVNYNFNMVVIHNKHPRQMGLLEMLDAYIEHQKEVMTNRSNYELAKSRKRLHIIEGLIKMVSIIDQVIRIIRQSKNKADAKVNLCETYEFTEEQAEAIVTLQLYRLSSTDIQILEEEARELTERIQELIAILNDEKKLIAVIIDEINGIKKAYKNPRRTEVQEEIETIQISQTDIIKDEDAFITVSKEGYIRATRTFLENEALKSGQLAPKDYYIANLKVNNFDDLLVFTNKGNYLVLHVHQINVGKGEFHHLNDYVKLDPDESIINVIPVHEYREDLFLLIASKKGYIKRTALSELNISRNFKTYTAIGLKEEGDAVVDVALSDDRDRTIYVVTKLGYMNRYTEDQTPVVKAKAQGVKSINLKPLDEVVNVLYQTHEDQKAVLLTQRGNLKTVNPNEIPLGSRANRGTMTLKNLKKNNHEYIGACLVTHGETYIVEEKEGYTFLVAETQSLSDLTSNGKAQKELSDTEGLVRLSSITTNEKFSYEPKEKVEKEIPIEKDDTKDESDPKAPDEIEIKKEKVTDKEKENKKDKNTVVKEKKTKKSDTNDDFEQFSLFKMENLNE